MADAHSVCSSSLSLPHHLRPVSPSALQQATFFLIDANSEVSQYRWCRIRVSGPWRDVATGDNAHDAATAHTHPLAAAALR